MSPQLWLRLDVDFVENKKIEPLHDRAFRFHVAALCYCARNLTDGHLDARAVKVVCAILGVTSTARIKELVEAKLWRPDEAGDGFWINDYLEHQQSAEEAKSRSAAGSAGANARWTAKRNANRTAIGNAQTENVGDNPLRTPTTWQPAIGHRDPAAAIRKAIGNGAITDHITLEAELKANPALTESERVALRGLIAA